MLLSLDSIAFLLHGFMIFIEILLLVDECLLLPLEVCFFLFKYANFFEVEFDGFPFLINFVILVGDFLVENGVIFCYLACLCFSVCPDLVGSFEGVVETLVHFLLQSKATSPKVLV